MANEPKAAAPEATAFAATTPEAAVPHETKFDHLEIPKTDGERYSKFVNLADRMQAEINGLDAGRYTSLALEKLEEVVTWAAKAMTHGASPKSEGGPAKVEPVKVEPVAAHGSVEPMKVEPVKPA